MRTLFAFITAITLTATAQAGGIDYHAYRANASLPMLTGEFTSAGDQIRTTLLGTRALINLARRRLFTDAVPPDEALALLVPKTRSPSESRIVVLNTTTNAVVATIATVTSLQIISPDNAARPSAGTGTVAVNNLANAEANFRGRNAAAVFGLRGSGTGKTKATEQGPQLSLLVTVHGAFERQLPLSIVANGVLAKGSFRASGKPLASITLP